MTMPPRAAARRACCVWRHRHRRPECAWLGQDDWRPLDVTGVLQVRPWLCFLFPPADEHTARLVAVPPNSRRPGQHRKYATACPPGVPIARARTLGLAER